MSNYRYTYVFPSVFALMFVLFVQGASAQQERVALITELTGNVELARTGSNNFDTADWGMPLYEGDRIRTASASEAVVLFSNSNILTVGAGNTFTISAGYVSSSARTEPVRSVDRELLAAASDLTLHRAGEGEIEVLGGLRSGGEDSEIIALYPRNTGIATRTPQFVWTSSEEFDTFRVIVRSTEGEIWSEITDDFEMRYPDSAPRLKPGVTYFWKIEAENMLDVLVSPLVQFQILSEEQSVAVVTGKEQIQALFESDGGSTSEQYMMGSMYVKNGLLGDAIDAFKQIAEAHPSSPMLHEILGKLYYEVGLKDRAVRALQTAITLR